MLVCFGLCAKLRFGFAVVLVLWCAGRWRCDSHAVVSAHRQAHCSQLHNRLQQLCVEYDEPIPCSRNPMFCNLNLAPAALTLAPAAFTLALLLYSSPCCLNPSLCHSYPRLCCPSNSTQLQLGCVCHMPLSAVLCHCCVYVWPAGKDGRECSPEGFGSDVECGDYLLLPYSYIVGLHCCCAKPSTVLALHVI